LSSSKERLSRNGVAPVLYLNNEMDDQDEVVEAIAGLAKSSPDAAKKVLPLIAFFRKGLTPKGGTKRAARQDFHWEREWRYPAYRAPFEFDTNDIFIGLCPDNEIDDFEELLEDVGFIDPRRNMKWYANKLIAARQRLDLKSSVV